MEFNRNSILIGDFEIRYYGILIALGVLLAVISALAREKRLGLKRDAALDLALICVPAAVIAARLYYVAFEWDMYSDNLIKILDIRHGGLAIYGGVIGGVIAGYVYARINKRDFWTLADLAAPSIALGQAIGRWGNFFNEEAFGAAVTRPAQAFFPNAVYISADGLWQYATFFYESAWCALIFVALILLERKGAFKRRGDVALWYVYLYALERSVVEGLRTDSLYWGAIRVSQALSLAALIAVCVVFVIRKPRPQKIIALAAAICLSVWLFAGGGVLVAVIIGAACLSFGAWGYFMDEKIPTA